MIPRKAMLKLQNRRCYLCGGKFTLYPPGTPYRRRLNRTQCITADHVRPRKAGATLEWNKLLAHNACNVRKADREPRPCELIYLAAINLRIAAMTPSTAFRSRPVMAEKQDRQRLLTGNLTLLMALEANGLDKQAGALVEKIGEGLRRRPAAKAVDQARVELQPAERGRSTHDIARLDDINARLIKGYRSDKRSTAEDKREADLKARQELENRLDVKRDTQAVRLGIEESAELAATRGETISEDKSGVKRILDRDPLLSLARCGKLSADQLEVGQIVREMYDARGEDAGAIEYTGMPGSAHDHEKFVSRRFTRAKACARIGQIERALAGRKPYDPNALVMLRWVCEQGHSLTSKGRGRAYDRNAASLALALDVADDVLQRRA